MKEASLTLLPFNWEAEEWELNKVFQMVTGLDLTRTFGDFKLVEGYLFWQHFAEKASYVQYNISRVEAWHFIGRENLH